jgi:hypothetical protein
MPSGLQLTSTGFSDTVRIAIIRDVLSMLRAEAVYALPESILPLGPDPEGGNSFVRKTTLWTDFPAANAGLGSTLVEYTPPTPRQMAEDSISVTVAEVGDYVPVSSQAAYQYGEGKALAQVISKVARMEFLMLDNYARAAYAAGTADLFAGTASSIATLQSGNVLTTALVDELVTRAREQDLQPFSDGLFRIIGGPRAFKGLLTEAATNGSGFLNQANGQQAPGDLRMGVIGDYHGARFIGAGSRQIVTAAQVGPAIPAAGTAAIAATDTITTTGNHGLVAGNQVRVVTITGGAGLAAATNYFVVAPVGATTFKVSATKGGAAIDITSDSSAISLAYVDDVYRSVLVGKNSIAMADPGSLQHYVEQGGGVGDPLHQTFATVGFRGFYGAGLVSIANFSDGVGTLSADIKRSLTVESVGL